MASNTVLASQFLPILDAIEKVMGHRVSPSTAHRWATSTKREPLKSRMHGGRRFATVEMVQEFVNSRTAAASPTPSPEAAQAKLDQMLG